MQPIASIGAVIKVTPWDDIYVATDESTSGYIDDRTPFEFRVEGRLEDGQIFYGLFGPVTSGPDRYHNLICNIMVRVDGSDWRESSSCHANFIVGPSKVERDHAYDFRHPDGVVVVGFPKIARFGEICVVSHEA